MKTDFKPGRWGCAFKNGKLYWFEPRSVVVMTGWPDPRAWLKRPSHGWRPTRKWADSVLAPHLFASGTGYEPEPPDPAQPPLPEWYEVAEQRRHNALGGYFDTIPDAIRGELLRYATRKWHMLSMFARCPGADDLSGSNAALAYALASNWLFHKPAVTQPVRATRRLVSRKQKHILAWLGFPASEPTRRILAKIVPLSLTVEGLLYLRDALTDPWVIRTLSHLSRINYGALRLTTSLRLRPHVTPRLIEDLSRDHFHDVAEPRGLQLFWDTLRMGRILDWVEFPRQFVSWERLASVHDDMAQRLGVTTAYIDTLPARFPAPPFIGNVEIQPIRSPQELQEEGQGMHHCVIAYAHDVAAGQQYVYRVLAPVRATLAITRTHNGWVCSQMKGVWNAPIAAQIQKSTIDQLLRTPQSEIQSAETDVTEWSGWPDPDPVGPWTRGPQGGVTLMQPAPPEAPIVWDSDENARKVASLRPEDRLVYEKCRTVFARHQEAEVSCR